jgi:hypothetical protein
MGAFIKFKRYKNGEISYMTPGEIGPMLTNLNNIQIKLEAASEAAVAVERSKFYSR